MAKLKDVQYAMNGDSPQQEGAIPVDLSSQLALAESAQTSVEGKTYIFKLVNTSKKGGTYIPNIDDVINPKTGKLERIRLLAGVDTIWFKEQDKITTDYVRQNSRTIEFPRGTKILRVPEWDHTLLEFVRICRHNINGPNKLQGSKFALFEYDPGKAASAALEKEELELEMAFKAKELSDIDVKKYASFVKIGFNDEIGEPKTPDALKRELILYAKRNAESFKKLIGEGASEVELTYLVRKAIQSNQIDVSTYEGRPFWANGGKTIGAIPKGVPAIKYLTELAMTNSEDGRAFLTQIQTLKI